MRAPLIALALWLLTALPLAAGPTTVAAPPSKPAPLPKSLTVYYVTFGAEGFGAVTPENIRQRSNKFTVAAPRTIAELDRLLHSEYGGWPFLDQDVHLRVDAPDGACLFLVDHYGVVRQGGREYILSTADFQRLGRLLNGLLAEDRRRHPRKMPKPPPDPPLIAAVNGGDYARVKALLARESSANIRDRRGETALNYAVMAGYERIVELLLENKADPNLPGSEDTPALLYAEHCDHSLAITRLLLAHRAKPDAYDEEGRTALFAAAGAGNVELTRLLLEHGAKPDFRRGNEATALIHAAHNGQSQTVALLLAHGADATIQTEYGLTALKAAQEGGDPATIALLEKAKTP